MTLDEAIQHAEEVAMSGCTECHNEHGQLAEWLKDYKEMKLCYALVVHGKWKMNSDYPDTLICSNCDSKYDVIWIDRGSNYCPHCGAKMEV